MLNPIHLHNKTAASIQITADQLILESVSRMRDRPRLPELEHQSQAELEDERFKRRQAWELNVRRNLCSYHTYIRYARWEEGLNELEKARSVFERGLEFSRYREPEVWMCYIDMELRHKQISYARNLMERSVKILPRHDPFWLKYAQVEENFGNIEGTRRIFQRWIAWEPPTHAFLCFVEFEARVREFTRARSVFERLLIVHPYAESYLRYADFEIKLKQPARARRIFERGLEALGENDIDEKLIITFAEFEEGEGEIERARALYKYALEKLPENRTRELYPSYLQFEKRFGGQKQIEDAVVEKKRLQYQQALEEDPYDYDSWFELCELLQNIEDVEVIRATYEKAVSNPPQTKTEKQQWSRYVLLCIKYAIFEEKIAKSPENARKVYYSIIDKVPHKKFTFSRLWVLYAYFEIRQDNLNTARTILGHSIGTCPRSAVFDAYIEIETILGEKANVRKLFDQYIKMIPSDVRGWVKYAQFEFKENNIDKARNLFEEAIESHQVESIDLLWAYYIQFETETGNADNIRKLYRRSIEANNKIGLWKGLIFFEAENCNDIDQARKLFDEAELSFAENREERKKLREFRVVFEERYGDTDALQEAIQKVPKVDEEDGTILFPEENETSMSSLLEAANNWDREKV